MATRDLIRHNENKSTSSRCGNEVERNKVARVNPRRKFRVFRKGRGRCLGSEGEPKTAVFAFGAAAVGVDGC